MTTASWSTRVRHDSDAVFREWGSEFATQLAAVGLVQTSDTGQINWASVTRAGTNSNAGYEIWRMDDTAQGTAPVYFRIDYGTGTATSNPRIQITCGTGTNGSGTLTGTALSIARSVHGNAAQTSDTARQSYMCANEGFFGFLWKAGSGTSEALFIFCRTCDSDGVPDARGAILAWGSGGAGALTATQAMRYAATAAAYTAQTGLPTTALGLFAQAQAASTVGTDNQVMVGYTITPRMEPLFGVCGVLDGEVALGNTFSIAMVGASARTFIGLSTVGGPFGPNSAAATGGMKFAMLWE